MTAEAGLEERIGRAAATGELVDVPGPLPAEILTRLLAGTGPRPRAVKIRGARITGVLDLEARTIACPLLLRDCRFDNPINLREATARAIRLPGCHVPGLDAGRLRTTGGIELTEGFTANGEVRLLGAHIGGQLDLSGARISNPGGYALNADLLALDQSMYARDGFTTEGELRLLGAHIGGQLDLSGAHLSNPGGYALNGDLLTVDQAVFCRYGFTADGEVCLLGGHIGGGLDLSGAYLTNPDGHALNADGCRVAQDMYGRDTFTTIGEARLLGAHIGGQLDLSGAHLTNPGGYALNGDSLTVTQAMFARDAFTANGEVCLVGARIGGELNLTGAHLTNPGAYALNGDSLTVGHAVHCSGGFVADGEVQLLGSKVGGLVSFAGAVLNNGQGRAVNLYSAEMVRLDLTPARPPDGLVDLAYAKADLFVDDAATWPRSLDLRGFTYTALGNADVGVRRRLGWLARHTADGTSRFVPRIYDQLAAAYRRDGREEAARRVAVAKQWRSRSRLSPLNWLQYATVGYGYRTWLAAVWLLALAAVGTGVFSRAHAAHLFHAAAHAPAFHPGAYAVDVLLPIIDLGQQQAWTPQGWALYWSWALISAGWVLSTAVVAGLTGVLKRD